MKKYFFGIFSLCSFGIFAQWTTQSTGFGTPSRGVNSIGIVTADTVWVGAYDGSPSNTFITDFSKTINAGLSWTPGVINTGLSGVGIANISAIDSKTAWACIYHPNQTVAGGIWKTTDGGFNWSHQTTAAFSVNSFPDFVYFWNVNEGITVGDPVGGYFEIYTTADGGTTWTRTANTSNQLQEISTAEYGTTNSFSVTGGTLWFGTTAGRVFKTTDKGSTFTNSTVANGISDVQRISFANADTGYACMHTGNKYSFKISKTVDGGLTWSALQNNNALTNSSIFGGDICAVPGTNALVSVGGVVQRKGSSWSSDGGLTWNLLEDTSLAPTRISVKFLNALTGWAGGFNTNAFTDGIYKASSMVGIVSYQSVQRNISLFPNPATDFITINFGGRSKKQISIEIVNLLGEKIISEKMSAGSTNYFKDIDVSSISEGVYFVIVQDGDSKMTAKFVKQ